MKILKLFIVAFLGVFLITNTVWALNEVDVWENDIYVETIPENPEPYQDVWVKISSYATDLNKAMIEWRSGSSLLLSGYGETKYSFQTQGPNTYTVLDIYVIPEGYYQKIAKRVIINPTEVDMLWEAVDGYTPPFYKGKSFVSNEGTIKVVALPIVKTGINSSKISYQWRNDDSAQESVSGFNKNYYVFKNDMMKTSEKVSVNASSVDGKYNATDSIEIPIISPNIIFYKKSPTDGVLYSQALVDNTYFPESEFTIVAEPYFLALKGNESLFSYNWKVNNNTVTVPNKKREITLRPTARDGYATISIVMENFNTLFQKITGQLRISL